MNIQNLPLQSITPYDKNPRKNDMAVDKVANSIKEFGFNQPIVVDKAMTIVVGHTRYKAAKKLNLSTIPVLVVDDISDEKLQAYRIADNKLNELAEWDDDTLMEELKAIIDSGNQDLTGFTQEEIDSLFDKGDDSIYTKKIDSPMYEPKGEKPDLSQLYNEDHYTTLVNSIKDKNIPKDVKEFLLKAAARHRVFDYHMIAEYYCHAEPEVQELMEDSALIIIDFDKAIELGYVNLTKELQETYDKGDSNGDE